MKYILFSSKLFLVRLFHHSKRIKLNQKPVSGELSCYYDKPYYFVLESIVEVFGILVWKRQTAALCCQVRIEKKMQKTVVCIGKYKMGADCIRTVSVIFQIKIWANVSWRGILVIYILYYSCKGYKFILQCPHHVGSQPICISISNNSNVLFWLLR